jgi:uncharacterized protein (TIGR04255 family)
MKKLKLSKSPLIMVVAQVRFSPVLKIDNFVPDIQEALRRGGYPRFEEEIGQEFKLLPGSEAIPQVRNLKRWIFSSPDKKHCITLTDHFVALETAQYDIFETFVEQFGKILDLLEKKVDLTVCERVGLRYVDLLRKNNKIESYGHLQPTMRGLIEAKFPDSQLPMNSSISQVITPYGAMLVRAVQMNDGNFLPPELIGTKLEIKANIEKGDAVTVLDIDHNGEFLGEFKSAHLIERLNKLHVYTDLAFRAAVTKEAIEIWT